jgi:hypothetical protein
MRGDHVYVKRLGYTHHGVEVDDRQIVHFTGSPGSKRGAAIRRTAIEEFTGPRGKLRYRRYGCQLSADEAVARAESMVGASGYRLFSNNCEHFATYCVADRSSSAQVNAARAAGLVATTTAAGSAAGIGVISGVGAAAGLSGPGIMSGLATVGGAVGTGAVGGLVVLGIAPAASAVAVMQVALRDDPALTEGDRSARRVGRATSAAGAVGGTAAGVAAVSTAGVTGLSAAGITSGLATIGATVGGGMAAGSAIVIAAPAVAAAGIGFGAYLAVRKLRDVHGEDPGTADPSGIPSPTSGGPAGPRITMLAFQDIDAITGEVIRNAEVATPVVEPATTEDLISIS